MKQLVTYMYSIFNDINWNMLWMTDCSFRKWFGHNDWSHNKCFIFVSSPNSWHSRILLFVLLSCKCCSKQTAFTVTGHHQKLSLQRYLSAPDADFSCHPAQVTKSAEAGHQGIITYRSLYAIGQSHVSSHGCQASWQTTQTAVLSILVCCIAAQCQWANAAKGTD